MSAPIHISIAGMAPFLICALIDKAPRVTTRSPGASPCGIAIRPPDLEPSWTSRGANFAPPLLSGWATNTTDLPSSSCTASSGTEGAEIAPPPWAETLANISGLSRSPWFRITARIGRVRVEGSSPAPTASIRAENVSAGYAGTGKRPCAPTRHKEARLSAWAIARQVIIGDGAIVVLLGNRLEGEEPLRSFASTARVARLRAGFVDVGLVHSCRGTLEGHEDLSGANAIPRPHANRNHPPLHGCAESGGAIVIRDHLARHGRDGSHGTRRYWFPVHATVPHLGGGERNVRGRLHSWHVGHSCIRGPRLGGRTAALRARGYREQAKPERPHGRTPAAVLRLGNVEGMATPPATSSSTTLPCLA